MVETARAIARPRQRRRVRASGEGAEGTATGFEQFLADVETEARQEGPKAVRELDVLHARFRLASQILALRLARRMTQRELAAATGIGQAEISRLERGMIDARAGTLARVATAVGARLVLLPEELDRPGSPLMASAGTHTATRRGADPRAPRAARGLAAEG